MFSSDSGLTLTFIQSYPLIDTCFLACHWLQHFHIAQGLATTLTITRYQCGRQGFILLKPLKPQHPPTKADSTHLSPSASTENPSFCFYRHGCSASCPADVTEGISVDMGCVGNGLSCTERTVSICPKDSHGPYSYEVVGKLIEAAKAEGADYAVDIYPFYGSDVEATLTAGADIRHGLIGPGVYASHGYERSHIDGVWNTLKVLKGYLRV